MLPLVSPSTTSTTLSIPLPLLSSPSLSIVCNPSGAAPTPICAIPTPEEGDDDVDAVVVGCVGVVPTTAGTVEP